MLKQKMPSDKEVKRFSCPAGDRKKPVYKYVFDENYGCPRRVLNGYTDLQDFIQQSADDVDFASIGKMLVDTKNNVLSHFVSKDGEVVDVTGLPRNIHEVNALHNKMKASFDSLPQDVKVMFNNDFDTFRKAYNKGNLAQILSASEKKVEKVTTESETE